MSKVKEKWIQLFALTLGFAPITSPWQRLIVVIAHAFLWLLFLCFPLVMMRVQVIDVRFVYRELFSKAALILFFYVNYYWLLPKLFAKRQITRYVLIVIAGSLLYLVLQVFLDNRFRYGARSHAMIGVISDEAWADSLRNTIVFPPDGMRMPPPAPGPGWGAAGPPEWRDSGFVPQRPPMNNGPMRGQWAIPWKDHYVYISPFMITNTLTSVIVMLLLSTIIKMGHSLYNSQRRSKQLETEKLNAELNWLKLQINPHFLFNTLNSIYSQAHLKSNDTEKSILKFSDIMRYVVYDSHEEKVSLRKDLNYIKNYIDLQTLRLSRHCKVSYHCEGDVEGLRIAPLLLITYIENAFKHGVSYHLPSFIDIRLKITEKELELCVRNSIVNFVNTAESGIGMENARRRLNAIYNNRFELLITNDTQVFQVILKIDLDYDIELPDY